MVLVSQPCQIMHFQIQASLISKSDRIWPLARMLDSCSKKIISLMANSSCLYQSSLSADNTLSHCALATDLFKIQLFMTLHPHTDVNFLSSHMHFCLPFLSLFTSPLSLSTVFTLYLTHLQVLCFSGIKFWFVRSSAKPLLLFVPQCRKVLWQLYCFLL